MHAVDAGVVDSIVLAALEGDQRFACYTVDDPVFGVDASRPAAAQAESERFGLADSFKGRSLNVANEEIVPAQQGPILLLPEEVSPPRLEP